MSTKPNQQSSQPQQKSVQQNQAPAQAPEAATEQASPEQPTTPPAVEPKAPVPPAPSAQPVPPVTQVAQSDQPLTTNQRVIVAQLAEYVEVMSASILTAASLEKGAKLLAAAVTRVLAEPSPRTQDLFYALMVEYRDGLMSERLALRGIPNIPVATRAQVELLYSLYRRQIKGDRGRIDKQRVVEQLGLPVLEYINNKK